MGAFSNPIFLITLFTLFYVAIDCESLVANAIRNAGLTDTTAELLSGFFLAFVLIYLLRKSIEALKN